MADEHDEDRRKMVAVMRGDGRFYGAEPPPGETQEQTDDRSGIEQRALMQFLAFRIRGAAFAIPGPAIRPELSLLAQVLVREAGHLMLADHQAKGRAPEQLLAFAVNLVSMLAEALGMSHDTHGVAVEAVGPASPGEVH